MLHGGKHRPGPTFRRCYADIKFKFSMLNCETIWVCGIYFIYYLFYIMSQCFHVRGCTAGKILIVHDIFPERASKDIKSFDFFFV